MLIAPETAPAVIMVFKNLNVQIETLSFILFRTREVKAAADTTAILKNMADSRP